MTHKRIYDIVIWGASGFTGKLVYKYFLKNYQNKTDDLLKWAIAGRDLQKLSSFLDKNTNIPILVGDSYNLESLIEITSKTKVILTTVGPYSIYGENLINACIQTHTDYCDLTGEIPFIKNTIKDYHELALSKKIKIVHSCGFDSVPSDLGVFYLQKKSMEKLDRPLEKVRLYVKKIRGGVSGGTIASMLYLIKNSKDITIRKLLKNPYSLYPKDIKSGPKQPNLKKIKWDNIYQRWIGPFIMSGFNSAIVRRTNALLNFKYGENFIYDEVSSYSKGYFNKIIAIVKNYGLGILIFLLYFKISRTLLKNIFLPKPGDGPSEKLRNNGYFILELIGIQNKKKFILTISCNSDPGYSGTAIMIAESAITLALNRNDTPNTFGVLTPTTGMGEALIKRLIKSGMKFEFNSKIIK